MATNDPYVSDDLKRLATAGVRPGVIRTSLNRDPSLDVSGGWYGAEATGPRYNPAPAQVARDGQLRATPSGVRPGVLQMLNNGARFAGSVATAPARAFAGSSYGESLANNVARPLNRYVAGAADTLVGTANTALRNLGAPIGEYEPGTIPRAFDAEGLTPAAPRPVDPSVRPGATNPPTETPMLSNINAGPPTLGAQIADKASLPPGVRYLGGDPTNNTGVYTLRRGRYGERVFTDNPYNPYGDPDSSLSPGMRQLAQARSAQIGATTLRRNVAANEAAALAAVAPKTAAEYTKRLDVLQKAPDPVTQRLAQEKAGNENIQSDPYEKAGAAAREAWLKTHEGDAAGASTVAQRTAAQLAADAGADPDDPRLTPTTRAGLDSVKQNIVAMLNGARGRSNFTSDAWFPWSGVGHVAPGVKFSDLEYGRGWWGAPVVYGPVDENGNRRAVRLTDDEDRGLAPYFARKFAKQPKE